MPYLFRTSNQNVKPDKILVELFRILISRYLNGRGWFEIKVDHFLSSGRYYHPIQTGFSIWKVTHFKFNFYPFYFTQNAASHSQEQCGYFWGALSKYYSSFEHRNHSLDPPTPVSQAWTDEDRGIVPNTVNKPPNTHTTRTKKEIISYPSLRE